MYIDLGLDCDRLSHLGIVSKAFEKFSSKKNSLAGEGGQFRRTSENL